MKIGIIGAGAMGGLYGVRIALSGVQVSMVEKNPDAIASIQNQGFHLSGITGDHFMTLDAGSDPARLDPVDVAFIHTDTNNTAKAALHAKTLLKEDGFAVTFQNGIGNVELLQNTLGKERVLGGISYHSARLDAPAHSVHTNANTTWIGELNGEISDRVRKLDSILSKAGFSVEVVHDIESVIWTKFVLNCAVNPICALTRLRTGEIGQDSEAKHLQHIVVEEILSLLDAKQIALRDPDIRSTIAGFSGTIFNKPSMLQHMENGSLTEIDALNGAAVREAESIGMKLPYNAAITSLVKAANLRAIREFHEPPIDYDALERAAEQT
jgi:2-dehydropantoate 2-reductase